MRFVRPFHGLKKVRFWLPMDRSESSIRDTEGKRTPRVPNDERQVGWLQTLDLNDSAIDNATLKPRQQSGQVDSITSETRL